MAWARRGCEDFGKTRGVSGKMCRNPQQIPVSCSWSTSPVMASFFQKWKEGRKGGREGGRRREGINLQKKIKAVACHPLRNKRYPTLSTTPEHALHIAVIYHVSKNATKLMDPMHWELGKGRGVCVCVCVCVRSKTRSWLSFIIFKENQCIKVWISKLFFKLINFSQVETIVLRNTEESVRTTSFLRKAIPKLPLEAAFIPAPV